MNTYYLLFLLTLPSCYLSAQKPTDAELAQTLKDAVYDTTILRKIETYQQLGDFLNKNVDAILAHADSKNTVLKGLPFFEYYYNSVVQNTNIKDMPRFVYLHVESLWKTVGEDNIISLCFYTDKTTTITVKIEKKPHNTILVHQLIWNIRPKDNNHSFDLLKDKSINNNCVYWLGVSEDHSGW